MTKKNTLRFNRPSLFSSAFTRQILDTGDVVVRKNFQELSDTNVESTSSFRYDPPGSGIKSTQQVPLDYSQFSNHTFFNSAIVNVNVSFDRIINHYPFDGTKKQIEDFLDTLTGFENYVFESFPRYRGYLNFSSSYISVKDFAGNQNPTLSRLRSGENILDPGLRPFSIETHLFVPTISNDSQIICQKLSGSNMGFSLSLVPTGSTANCDVLFSISSGSAESFVSTLTSPIKLQKGEFNHIVATFDRRPGINKTQIFINENLSKESDNILEMGEIDFKVSPLTIGSGSSFTSGGSTVTPGSMLSGALDEFRMFHDLRPINEQKVLGKKGIFASPNLKLYFKFNEPPEVGATDSSANALVLDSSGNSLHSTITNFTSSLRATGSLETPMIHEKDVFNPVLFPTFAQVGALNDDLLFSASLYDDANPNLITKLVPDHYFLEGQFFEAFETEDGTISESYGGDGIPGEGELGSAQLLSALLYVWAKHFDEMKISLDAFGNTLHVDYDEEGTVPDQFLPFLAQYFGANLPDIFSGASVEQFVDAENLGTDVGTATSSLQQVQNLIWRRILTNFQEIIKSKGTIYSLKSLIRRMGIDPDSNFRFKEFGGPTKRSLSVSRETKTEVSTLIDFSGSLAAVSSSLNPQGVPNNKPVLISEPLVFSTTGIFLGYPSLEPTPAPEEMLTSGSFSYEGIYRFPKNINHFATQSLVRINASSSIDPPISPITNLVALSGSSPEMRLFVRNWAATGGGGSMLEAPLNTLILTGADIFDGNQWNVSFGRYRRDDPFLNDEILENVSSSYFIRASRQSFGEIKESYVTRSFFKPPETFTASQDFLSFKSPTFLGPVMVIGSSSIDTTTAFSSSFLLSPDLDGIVRSTEFSGRTGHNRVWSRGLREEEWKEHVKNYKSLGVKDPLVNFNFVNDRTGSFERIRLDTTSDQPVTESNASGEIQIFDFSQNSLHLNGTGFEASTRVIKPETFNFSFISPNFDEGATSEKVRVRGFQDYDNVADSPYAEVSPVFEIDPVNDPDDDVRFSIEFSVIDALDQDIITIFSELDALDNILGDPNLLFSPDYPDLENLRIVYFNRLTDRINLKGFFEFFKWFDTSIGMLIEQLIPRKTKFLGMNFVVESHMLERPKFEYLFNEIYLGDSLRTGRGTILLQQLSGILRKF